MSNHSVIHRYLSALIIFVAVQVPACRARPEWTSTAQRFDALSRVESSAMHLTEAERIAAIGARYDQIVAPVRTHPQLENITDDDLQDLYHAAQLAASYTHDQEHVRDMATFLNGLQGRGLASKIHYIEMHEAFIGARMLIEADALARQHPMPELEVLPELHDAVDVVPGHPTEWVVNLTKRELLRRNVDLRQSAQVVIVSHPLCHFSRAAMRDIQADPVLGKVFEEHAKWLAPQDNHINFNVFQKWNLEHPTEGISLTVRREEWPMIDTWATPTFYFLKDGAVTAKVEGWPKKGRRSELLAALRQVGLLQ